MSNPFFTAVGNQQSIGGVLQQFKSNPIRFLMQRRFNVPQSMADDPNAILQHLLSTGQINQSQVNSAYQMAQRFK